MPKKNRGPLTEIARVNYRRARQGKYGAKVSVLSAATSTTPGYGIAKLIGEALDPTRAPGKVRTMSEMSREELAKITPPGLKSPCPDLDGARRAARYYGAEAKCNDLGMNDYRNDLAIKYGYQSWAALPKDLRADATRHYLLGRADERRAVEEGFGGD